MTDLSRGEHDATADQADPGAAMDGGRITTPWPFDEFTCPACERGIPTRKQIRMAMPAKYEHMLNQCFKCPWCNFIFSPRRPDGVLIRR